MVKLVYWSYQTPISFTLKKTGNKTYASCLSTVKFLLSSVQVTHTYLSFLLLLSVLTFFFCFPLCPVSLILTFFDVLLFSFSLVSLSSLFSPSLPFTLCLSSLLRFNRSVAAWHKDCWNWKFSIALLLFRYFDGLKKKKKKEKEMEFATLQFNYAFRRETLFFSVFKSSTEKLFFVRLYLIENSVETMPRREKAFETTFIHATHTECNNKIIR